jgi:hypothetical protein
LFPFLALYGKKIDNYHFFKKKLKKFFIFFQCSLKAQFWLVGGFVLLWYVCIAKGFSALVGGFWRL